ncbi:HAD family hydrolase [uncultured Tenacibaculum sp.]|uniref:HAD family hydrolase n=1 Tax=uncultured Tenacibaculum sp. TaxID=174713 RepID=UPI002616F752|nr:HAD family hydrolase [uncultured Tenacibaculum sp.]
MNISFDLDSTLIPNGKEFETENISKVAKLFGIEEIRKGTSKLIFNLQKQGHKVHIYTTSFRSKRKIRRTLKYYGIKVSRIINEKENRRVLNSLNSYASKFPPAFNFHIHIDDLKGVGIEGEKYGFKTIIIKPSDKDWIIKINNKLKELENII